MKVIAKSIKGAEFWYNPETAHKVSERSAETILKVLNDCKYKLQNEKEVWHIHDVYPIDKAYAYAESQKFTIRKGTVRAITYR